MAAAAVDETQDKIETGWDLVKREITCVICKKIFTDPRILSCSHTFCKQCIDDRSKEACELTETFQACYEDDDDEHEYINTAACCPRCLAPLPQDGSSSSNSDSAMNSLIEIFMRRQDSKRKLVEVTCGVCREKLQQVTTWCLPCHRALCTNCKAIHSKQRGVELHTTIPIVEFVEIHRQPCRTHKQKMLDLYCSTCELLACPECIEDDHLEHKFDIFTKELEGATQIIAPLKKMAERARKRKEKAIEIPKRQNKSEDPALYVGMYDFLATEYNELSFSKGDLLYIISDDGDWWFAKAKNSGKEGYIPRTFITERKALEDYEWFFGCIDLKEAKRKLLHSCNSDGAYLVYQYKDSPSEYCLAVRLGEKVCSYRIRYKGGQHFIDMRVTFGSIQELVAHYSKSSDHSFIKTTLKRPCAKSEFYYSSHAPTGVLEIEKKQICFIKKLGEGQIGIVWQGVWNAITPVAVKILKPGMMGKNEFLQEIPFIKQLNHPNLVELYAVSSKEEPIYIVTELTKHGSLLEYLRGDGLSLKLSQQVGIMTQVATGMTYLEEKGFIHCNLAARNVIVFDNLFCKVTDHMFGQFVFHQTQNEDFCVKWTSPEALLHGRFSIKSDVWSFGVFLYEVITYGGFPYPGMSNALVLKTLRAGARMWRPIGCPEKLYKIMKTCWKGSPNDRPTFSTLQWQLDDFFIN